eukprot:284817308_3
MFNWNVPRALILSNLLRTGVKRIEKAAAGSSTLFLVGEWHLVPAPPYHHVTGTTNSLNQKLRRRLKVVSASTNGKRRKRQCSRSLEVSPRLVCLVSVVRLCLLYLLSNQHLHLPPRTLPMEAPVLWQDHFLLNLLKTLSHRKQYHNSLNLLKRLLLPYRALRSRASPLPPLADFPDIHSGPEVGHTELTWGHECIHQRQWTLRRQTGEVPLSAVCGRHPVPNQVPESVWEALHRACQSSTFLSFMTWTANQMRRDSSPVLLCMAAKNTQRCPIHKMTSARKNPQKLPCPSHQANKLLPVKSLLPIFNRTFMSMRKLRCRVIPPDLVSPHILPTANPDWSSSLRPKHLLGKNFANLHPMLKNRLATLRSLLYRNQIRLHNLESSRLLKEQILLLYYYRRFCLLLQRLQVPSKFPPSLPFRPKAQKSLLIQFQLLWQRQMPRLLPQFPETLLLQLSAFQQVHSVERQCMIEFYLVIQIQTALPLT